MSTPRIGLLVQIGESGQRVTSLARMKAVRLGSGAHGGQAADGTPIGRRSDVNRGEFKSRPRLQAAPQTYQEGVDRLSRYNPESGRYGAAACSIEWCGETILALWWWIRDRGGSL
jgi:hypothetical protein